MSFYGDMAAVASSMIAEFGQTVTIVTQGTGVYSAATGTVTQTGGKSYPAKGAIFDYPERLIDGTRVMRGDKQVYLSVAGLPITPRPDMKLIDGAGVSHIIIESKTLAPALVSVMYELQVRH
jgi:hypothetical protein